MTAPTRSGKVICDFAEGKRELHLRIDELIILQEKLDLGPYALYARFIQNNWKVQHIREVIRLGLIGAGEHFALAEQFVDRNVKSGYLLECLPHAIKAISAALAGVPEDDALELGESQAPSETTTQED